MILFLYHFIFSKNNSELYLARKIGLHIPNTWNDQTQTMISKREALIQILDEERQSANHLIESMIDLQELERQVANKSTDMQENMWNRLRESHPGTCLIHATLPTYFPAFL